MAGMPDNPQRLPLRRAYPFLEAHGFTDDAAAIRLGPGGSPVHRGHAIEVLKRHGLLDEFIASEWPLGATQEGRRATDRYVARYKRFLEEGPGEPAEEEEEDSEETRFAYENQLRDYLANNLNLVEPGLKLWPVAAEARAVEYPVDSSGRRIDILAQDVAGIPVVIELKVSKGHERTIGQSLYYAAKIKETFDVEKVRIVIVASEISNELKLAASALDNVQLFTYRLQTTLTMVQ
jgi:hypothetical protein